MLAFRSGDKQTARELLAEASEHNPDNELVWLWRASVARTRNEACDAVQRVLDLNPSNEKAQNWIKKLHPDQAPKSHSETAGTPERDSVEQELPAARNGLVAEREEAPQTELETETAAAKQAEEAPEANAQPETQAPAEAEPAAEEAHAAHEEPVPQAEERRAEARAAEQDETPQADTQAEAPQAEAQAGQPEEARQTEAQIPSDAEARLAALEAYLQRGGREESETAEEQEPASQEVEGYGWDSEQTPAEESSSISEDLWGKLTANEDGDSDYSQDSDEDPLLGLLDDGDRMAVDARQSGYEESIDEDAESDPAKDGEYRDRLAELKSSSSNQGEDVWASLGMAGMDESGEDSGEEQARSLDEPAPEKAMAAAMGVVEEPAPEQSAEQDREAAPPAEAQPEKAVEGCFICEKLAPEQDGVCSSCRSIVALRLHELAPRHEGADRATLNAALDRLRAKLDDKPTAELYIRAAVTSLNLKQSNQALAYLREACRLRPHDRELLNYHDEIEKRPLVLAVDDSKTVQKMISTVLEKESYRVSQAEDGLAALAKLDEEMPTLVLLDITMPRMDGYQVCKVITGNEHTRHVPVIMLSGKDGFFDKVKGKMAGASNYITKPFDPNDLIKTVGKFAKKG